MSWVLIGSVSQTPVNGAALSLHADRQAGDLAVLCGARIVSAGTDPTWPGYTLRNASDPGFTGNTPVLHTRTLTGDAADTPNISLGETYTLVASVLRWDAAGAPVFDLATEAYTASGSATKVLPSVNAALAGSLIVVLHCNDNGRTYSAWTYPSAGMAELGESLTGTLRVGSAWGVLPSAGASGAGSVLMSGTEDGTCALAVFSPPAAVPPVSGTLAGVQADQVMAATGTVTNPIVPPTPGANRMGGTGAIRKPPRSFAHSGA